LSTGSSEARDIRQRLSTFYNRALPMLDEMPANPATHALRISVGPQRERVLSNREIRDFWKATEQMGTFSAWPSDCCC
jgi:hypothetical protein